MSASSIARDIAGGALIAVLGISAFIVPVFLVPMRYYPDSLFPLLRTGIEGVNGATVLCLLIVGMIAAIVRRPASVWRCGIEGIILLPSAAWLEATIDPTSHNLWPIELVIYAFESLFIVAGAAFVRLWLPRRKRTAQPVPETGPANPL